MRLKSRPAHFVMLPMLAVALTSATSLRAQHNSVSECSPVAVYKYSYKQQGTPTCQITVDRFSPGSPLPVQVPPKTNVIVFIKNQRPHEIIQAVVTNDAVAIPDIAGGILGKITSPLGALVFSPPPAGRDAPFGTGPSRQDDLNVLKVAQQAAYTSLMKVYAGYIAPTCLAAYLVFNANTGTCSQVSLVTDPSLPEPQQLKIFEQARVEAISSLSLAINPQLPADEAELDRLFAKTCPTDPISHSVSSDCIDFRHNEERINVLLSLLTTKTADAPTKKTLQTLMASLSLLMPLPPTVLPVYSAASNRKLTIKINSQEQITNSTTALATVVITWQQNNWSLSTGVVFSTLKNKTFSNSPIYNANGTPDVDSTGKVLTQVTVAKTYPGIIAPVFLVNYRALNFQANQGRFAFLLSGGLGLNPTTKSADFAVGPSLQWGTVIFGTVLHYGRQTELTSGVHVGDQLGTSPPAVPTVNAYKPAFGLAITYRLPLP